MTDYIELHCHSSYSLLDGASSPQALVQRAAALDMPVLALTDHDAVYGAVAFGVACREAGLRPILGAELTLADDSHLTLLVEHEAGWRNLNTLITKARLAAPKGRARLPEEILPDYTTGLIALSGCRQGAVAAALQRGDPEAAYQRALHLRNEFGREQVWIELQQHLRPEDQILNAQLVALADQLGLPYVATNNVHYAEPAGQRLQDVLVAIRHNLTLDEAVPFQRPNGEYSLKPAAAMAQLFRRYPAALEQTQVIADRCRFVLRTGLQSLPVFPTPAGLSAEAYLRQQCQQALANRLPTAAEQVRQQLEHELRIIQASGLVNYFLIVADIIRYAHDQGILCQGRGSAANSLVAYLLGISPVNPLAHDLVFERFLSAERQVVPDIDIDFDAERREEVIQYLYQRYDPAHAAMACTLVTFQARSAVRDVGKALGLPVELLDRLAAAVDRRDGHSEDLAGVLPEPTLDLIRELTAAIDELPRHLGIHNGGMILTGDPIFHTVATEPATMAERTVVQWDKTALEEAGVVKFDILGLRMLSAVDEAVRIVQTTTGKVVDFDPLGFDDPAVYDMIAAADTVGVFQVESRAQAQMLPRFRPTCFGDLIIAISLIRPGPIQGDMVHPYLRRRLGQEAVSYFHPALEGALQETMGVILFQEQVLKVARDLVGFTPGQGELLRRALGSKRPGQAFEKLHADFMAGAIQQGVDETTAETVFERLKAFGGYSFPKSHAAAFAVLVYRSAWLKRYHPGAFYTALLNHQPMGFWSPAVLVNDARRHHIQVLPVDIHRSQGRCHWDGQALRLGLNYVKGFGEHRIRQVLEAREKQPFRDLHDLCQRTQLPRRLVEYLILAGALDGWKPDRRALLWELGTISYAEETLALTFATEPVDLPQQTHLEALSQEYQTLGVMLHEHPLRVYRQRLTGQGVVTSRALALYPPGQRVKAAGLVVMHQAPPTAKGFHFVTLEDEYGFVNVVIRPQVYQQWRKLVRGASLLLVEGQIERDGAVTNLLAKGFRAL